jgi:L-lactate dehydrogenase complex protein LldG
MVADALSGDARAEVLAAIRRALGPDSARRAPTAPTSHERLASSAPPGIEALVQLFCERVADYRAGVSRVADDRVAATVADVAARHDARRVVVASGLPSQWRPTWLELVEDDGELTARELEEFDGALTAAGLGIAETGTLVLDGGPDQGRRALTLLPDLHICVVPVARVVADVPDAIRLLDRLVRTERRPVTFVSGPSATSDIELRRVEGVHGPRRLEVIVCGS